MDLSETVLAFATGTYTVTRQAKRVMGADGRITALPAPTTLSATASVQPVTGRDLQRLPEGLRQSEALVIFTPTLLTSGDSANEADVVSIDGDSYQVQMVERWVTLGGYYRAVALKV